MQVALKPRLHGTAFIADAPKGLLLADTGKRMRQIANAAGRLLKQLEIYDYRRAPDGPGDVTLLDFLASAENRTEDDIILATAQIGRLAEIFDAIDAARELEQRGRKAAEEAKHLSRLTSIKGRRGDYAANVWLAEMMSIYKVLTRKDPRISVVAGAPNRGKPSGPIRRALSSSATDQSGRSGPGARAPKTEVRSGPRARTPFEIHLRRCAR